MTGTDRAEVVAAPSSVTIPSRATPYPFPSFTERGANDKLMIKPEKLRSPE